MPEHGTFSPGDMTLSFGDKNDKKWKSSSNNDFQRLYAKLKNCDEKGFLTQYKSSILLSEVQTGLLIKAIELKKSNEVIDAILSNVTDINCSLVLENAVFQKFPIVIQSVCRLNNLGVFEKLLSMSNNKDLEFKFPPNVQILATFIHDLYESSFNKWFDILYNSKKFNVNEVDNKNRTLLWHAIWKGNNTAVKKLLKEGAYIGVASLFDINVFHFRQPLNPDYIKECFDSCIEREDNELNEIKFSYYYRNLVPQKKNDMNEMEAIMLIQNSKEHSHLLKHPLIKSYMALKWQRLARWLYINLVCHIAYIVSFVTYIFLCQKRSEIMFVIKCLTWCLTILRIVYLVSRELIQLLILKHRSLFTWKEYLKNCNKYLEFFLIGLSICAITMGFESSYGKRFIVFAIILMTIQLFNLVKHLPSVFVSTHMLMLQEVLWNFLKSFSLYWIFVAMFAFSFYILFGVESNQISKPEHNLGNVSTSFNKTEQSENSFENVFTSFIKTMAMLNGELDLQNMKLKTDICRNIVFFLFVICMPIVMMNLLNGLAVTDIKVLRNHADLNGLIYQAEFLKNHDYIGKLFTYDDEDEEICSCKYSCFVQKHYVKLSYPVIIPNRCALCTIKCSGRRESQPNTNQLKSSTNQSIFSRFVHVILDLLIKNPTVMEKSIVKESINVIINNENRQAKIKNTYN